MKIEVIKESSNPTTHYKISHGEKAFYMGTQAYERIARPLMPETFLEINDYWATKGPEFNQELSDIYSKIEEDLRVNNSDIMHERLKDNIQKLMDMHNPDEIKQWIQLKSFLRVPTNMKEELGPDDPPARTYLRSDYLGLMVVSMQLKVMIPIWDEYLRLIQEGVGNNYKEFMSLSLLYKTQFIKSPIVDRLRVYIEATIQDDSTTLSNILGGLGSADLPEWLLGLVLVRKISVIPLSLCDENSNLITNIYRLIKNTLDGLSRKFKGNINNKRRPNEGLDDDNISGVEAYKVKQEISDGDLVAMSVYAENLEQIVSRVDPDVPKKLFDSCVSNMRKHESMEISDHHLTIVQWVLSEAMSPRSIPLLNKPVLLNLIGVTQAILYHWDFKELALLVSGQQMPADEDEMTSLESRPRISKAETDELCRLFPHYQEIGGRNQSPRQYNPACRAIDALAKTIDAGYWKALAPQSVITGTYPHIRGNVFDCPYNIKSQLAQLTIFLACRKTDTLTTTP